MNYYGYEFIRETDLQHYGLKGMHWGTRHWQNYDATNNFNEAGFDALQQERRLLDPGAI